MKLLVLLGLAVVASCERQRFDGCDVWEVTPKTEKQLHQLHNFYERHDDERDTEVLFWEEPRAVDDAMEVLVCGKGAIDLRHFLGYSRIDGKIIRHNIQSRLDAIWARSDARHALNSRAYDPTDFNTLEDIMAYLQELYNKCPSGVNCVLEEIGQSYEGRPIMAFRMTQEGPNRKGIFVDSLIHCREWLAGTTVLGIMTRFVEGYGSNPEVTSLLDNYNWHFVPVVNPDGYSYTWTSSRFWRKTRSPNAGSSCIGTDANRNFPYMWVTPGASTSPCSDTYRGASSASEVEVQVILAAGEALRGELVLWLTFHTYGNYYLFPYGTVSSGSNCMTAPDAADLLSVSTAAISAIMDTYNTRWTTGSTCTLLYAASGGTADWAYGSGLVKYSYTPELRGPGFDPSSAHIQPSLEENWNGLLALIGRMEEIEGF